MNERLFRLAGWAWLGDDGSARPFGDLVRRRTARRDRLFPERSFRGQGPVLRVGMVPGPVFLSGLRSGLMAIASKVTAQRIVDGGTTAWARWVRHALVFPCGCGPEAPVCDEGRRLFAAGLAERGD